MESGKDQRKFSRFPLRTEIKYRHNGTSLAANTSDVSLTGVFIDTVNALDIGEEITFEFGLPGREQGGPVQGAGVVVWKDDFMGMGVRFTRMLKRDWQKLKTHIQNGNPG